jgi:outer membrane protein, heavy metal efflux system
MKRNLFIQFAVILISTGSPFFYASAQKVLTETEAVDLALKNSASFRSADLEIKQNKQLQKTSLSLPNPEVIAESPTGEFYAVGILQSLEFPTVYAQQAKLRKQSTRLSENKKEVTRQDVSKFIRQLYLNAQFARALYLQLSSQDSLYSNIAKSAQRQFDAGTIDYLERTFAASQAGEIHIQRIEAEENYNVLLHQLTLYTGLKENIMLADLVRSPGDPTLPDTTDLAGNPTLNYYQQAKIVNARTLSLEKNRALPGLVVGYLNQGARETETYYRFRVGVTLPIWFWQYNGSIKAARTSVAIAEEDLKAQQQVLSAEMIQVTSNVRKYSGSLDHYEQSGLTHANEIIRTAQRFFQSGQTDYVNYLRNTNEAFLIKTRYFEALRNYNQAIISLNSLTGKL